MNALTDMNHVIGNPLLWQHLINWNRLSLPSMTSSLPTSAVQLLRFRAAADKQIAATDFSSGNRHVEPENRKFADFPLFVQTTPPRKRMFPCSECRYATDRKNNLKRHITTMHSASLKQLDCCGLQFPSKAALRAHVSVFHSSGYTCASCQRVFGRKALLRRHLSVHDTTGSKQHSCSECDYSTSHKSNLDRHRKVHERVTDLPREHNSPVNQIEQLPPRPTSSTSTIFGLHPAYANFARRVLVCSDLNEPSIT